MTDSDADAIVAALSQLRGRRGPRPPWMDGAGHDGHGHGGPHGGFHGGPHHHPGHGAGPHVRFAGPARLRLLETLAAASAPLSVSELAEAIGVDQPRASRLVQQCVDMALVRREADPDDARRTRIVLTVEGGQIVRGFRGQRRDAVESALAGFSDDERAELARLLTKLAAAWPDR
ncbi:MarR family winged helix-turn-helix transcriptional regulator [Microbacterium terricola]|uniref:HTH marR-type domain-containing protein n=1 Tax=Microbacterium terricola TaxID=344163 RepID=A0ABM8E2L4_9MICO|nr:MarR family winged helix-turn-helix transcriptional regulator [Microbacterium terricola]UYK40096.1 MarR family winged helix-turn-helix transcriptional regulator [Microbacterium terricola]BDV32203.1 hypothetical protein Microterr_28630 [Microbacterium terricola]